MMMEIVTILQRQSSGSDYSTELSNNQQPEQKEAKKESSCKAGLL